MISQNPKVNSTVSCSEKITLHTVDLAGALLCAWFSLSEASSKPSSLWSRTFDLKSAYRQLPLAEDAFRHAVLSVYCPETQCPSLFQLKCLPFGESFPESSIQSVVLRMCVGVVDVDIIFR